MTQLALIARRRVVAPIAPPAPGGPSTFAFLDSPYTKPAGTTFNVTTGLWEGTTVNTARPAFALTLPTFTDTGNPATNMANLNAILADHATNAISSAVLPMPAGVRFAGQLQLRPNGFWFGIEPANTAGLPPLDAGTFRGTVANRLTMAHAGQCWEVYPAAINTPAIAQQNGAKKYWLRGLFVSNRDRVNQSAGAGLAFLQPTVQTVSANYCEDIIINQWLGDGFDSVSSQMARRIWYIGGRRWAIVNGTCQRVGITGADSQGVLAMFGEGPWKVSNNDMDVGGDSENFMQGGGGLPGADQTLLPVHGEVTGNKLSKPLWGNHKNGIELKFGKCVLIDGNDFTGGHNGGAQARWITIKLSNQNGGNTTTDTADIHITHNRARSGPGGITITGREDSAPGALYQTRRVFVANNEMCGFDVPTRDGEGLSLDGSRISDVVVVFNTFVGRRSHGYSRALSLLQDQAVKMSATTCRWNVLVGANAGNQDFTVYHAAGGGLGQAAWAFANVAPTLFSDNLVSMATAANWSNQRRVSSPAAIGFTAFNPSADSAAGWNLRLAAGSPGKGAGPDGQDLGVQYDLLATMMARTA